MMLKSSYKQSYKQDSYLECGIDEAGRGCLWGPLVAACVCWPSESEWTEEHRTVISQIRDSKTLSPKKRESLYESIVDLCTGYGVGFVDANEIDEKGATWANQIAFRRAIQSLKQSFPLFGESSLRFLIDGVLPLHTMESGESYVTIVDGDATYLSIAAASIVAKVSHDRWLKEWCEEEAHKEDAEKYDLLSCKGYGTAKHRVGILKHGYTSLHRKLYLRKLIPELATTLKPPRAAYDFVEDDAL